MRLSFCALALAGCGVTTIFPGDNAWNTRVDGAAIDARSADYLAAMGPDYGLHADFDAIGDGIPFVEVQAGQAQVPVTFTDYPKESDPGPYPIPDDAPIENGGDAHVIVVDRGNGFLYELYQGKKTAPGMWSAANGAKWNLRSNDGRPAGWTSADAAGLPIFPGLVRYDELKGGEIRHALRFTTSVTQNGYVAPASHAAGSCAASSQCPPMGLRLRLKADVDLSAFPQSVRVLLTALKQYGMILADNGSDWFISGAPDARWNDDEMHMLSKIHGSDFEVIDSGAITPQP